VIVIARDRCRFCGNQFPIIASAFRVQRADVQGPVRSWRRNVCQSVGLLTAIRGPDEQGCVGPSPPPRAAIYFRQLEPGDVLVVTRLDRLARSTRDLLNVLDEISKRGIPAPQH
jgi:Resolvase, N terminal domain